MGTLRVRCCRECGEALGADRDYRTEFCDAGCKRAWNNRRMVRGSELYDLFMACRYERGTAKLLGLWNLMCRMASAWRAEDAQARGGRPSWGEPRKVVERHTRYVATRCN